MELPQALALGRRLLDEHGLGDWTIVLDNAKARAGVCRPHTRQIGLSRHVTLLHPPAEVRDTLLHEIAHALVGVQHGHDEVWKAQARAIGGTATRCTDPDMPKVEGDWIGVCAEGHRVTRHRRPQRVASCRRCARGFHAEHILTWTYRGGPAPMHPAYAAELATLQGRATGEAAAGLSSVSLGTRVRVVAAGRHHGAVGEVVKRGRTRYHVRVPQGVLAVPFGLVEPT